MSDKKLILLYNPPSEFYAMPLGLLSVGSAVHGTAGINVRILDSRIDPDAEEVLLELAPQASCVGMTVFSGPPIGPALALARAVGYHAVNVMLHLANSFLLYSAV